MSKGKDVELLTPNGAADLAGVSLDTIQRAMKAGEFGRLFISKGPGGQVNGTSLDPKRVARWIEKRQSR